MTIQGYTDPQAESLLRMGPTGGTLVLVSDCAHVTSHLENGFDRQAAKGANFGRKKFLGVAPATFTVTFVVLPEEEDDFWSDVVPLLRPKGRQGAAPPIDIVNPQVNRIGITTVTVLSADIDPPSPRDGRTVTIQLEEWTKAPTPAKEKKRGVTNSTAQNLEPGATQLNQ